MTTALDHVRPVTGPARVGQSTAVEQSRAVAEVHAAVVVAQQRPRSIQLAIEDMEDACRQIELAEVAFFRFPRSDGVIEGPSVHLARELARCWGNIQYGIRELARDDEHGQSEMQAWAWDVQKNSRDSSDFIVPHKRDTKKGVKDLVDLRDIYENNANNGARRLREMIFAMLPVWYRARAEKLCRETIQNGGGVPLATRISDAVKAFERFRVGPARLAAKFGYGTVDELTAYDVAQLGVIWQSLSQGTVTVDDEFPADAGVGRPSAADITGQPQAPSPAVPDAKPSSGPAAAPPEAEVAAAGDGPPATGARVRAIWACLHQDYGYSSSEADTARAAVAALAGRPLGSLNELTRAEASRIYDQLRQWIEQARETGERPRDILAADIASRDTDPRGEDGQEGGGNA